MDDVTLVASQNINMADRAKSVRRKGGRYCVAGAPNNESCHNTTFTPGRLLDQSEGMLTAMQMVKTTTTTQPATEVLTEPASSSSETF